MVEKKTHEFGIHNERRKKQMINEGMNIEKIEKITITFLEMMQNDGLSLAESKTVINRVACILETSEKYRPETLLNKIPLRNS